MGTYRTKCDICGTENEVPNYGDWDCSQCGQAYDYDECHRIRLSPEQLAVLLAMPRWIPVSEQLPDDETELLVAWSGTDMTVSYAVFRHVDKAGEQVWQDAYGCDLKQPTHWMKLPEPPEVK